MHCNAVWFIAWTLWDFCRGIWTDLALHKAAMVGCCRVWQWKPLLSRAVKLIENGDAFSLDYKSVVASRCLRLCLWVMNAAICYNLQKWEDAWIVEMCTYNMFKE